MASSARGPRLRLTLALQLVSLLRLLVPRRYRAQWLAEWRGELAYLSRPGQGGDTRRPDVLAHSLNAIPHAAAYYRHERGAALLVQDLRYALRRLTKAPGFTAVAMLTLAIGVGANAAIFSVIDSTLWHPLPYPDADRLVFLWKQSPAANLMTTPRQEDLVAWRDHMTSFEQIQAYDGEQLTLTGGSEPRQLIALRVLPGFFDFLGVHPAQGRSFTDDEAREGAAVAVISDGMRRSHFGDARDVLGRTLTLDETSYAVIGVLPADFHFRAPFEDTPVWLPFSIEGRDASPTLFAIGRLKVGVTADVANQEFDALAANLAEQSGAASWAGRARRPQDLNGRSFRTSLLMMQGAVALVLLIACANVANLLLARGAGQGTEMAVRAALGAGRGRLFRLLLTEHFLLAIAGGILGYGLARVVILAIARLRPQELTALAAIRVDDGVFLFAMGLAVLTGIVFGLLPALQASRPDVVERLKDGSRSMSWGPARSWLRNGLVVGEVALSLVLLVGAGLLVGSLIRLVKTDLGFSTRNALTMLVSLPESRYPSDAQRREFRTALEARIQQIAGDRLVGMALSSSPLPRLGLWLGTFAPEGDPATEPFTNMAAHAGTVSPGFFATLGVSFVDGRDFIAEDVGHPDSPVIVNARWARQMWGTERAAGRRIRVEGSQEPSFLHIVGVVEDAMLEGPTDAIGNLQIFQPGADFATLSLVIRTTGDPLPLAGAFRKAVWSIDPDLPVRDLGRLEDAYASGFALPRFHATLLGAFAVVAVTLAVVGLYGVLSYAVGQRTQEIGIRLALGAPHAALVSMVAWQGIRMVLVGVGLGVVAAAGLAQVTQVIDSLLYETSAVDPVTYLAVSAVVVLVSSLACVVPAVRAARLDAVTVLRQ